MRLQEQKENVWLIRHASQISVTQRKLRRYGAPVIGLVLCMRTNGVIQHLYRKTSFHQCDLRDPPEQRSVSWLFRGFGSVNAESRGDCNASQKYRTVDRKAAFIAGKRLPALSRRDRNRRITYPRTILPGCITPLGDAACSCFGMYAPRRFCLHTRGAPTPFHPQKRISECGNENPYDSHGAESYT